MNFELSCRPDLQRQVEARRSFLRNQLRRQTVHVLRSSGLNIGATRRRRNRYDTRLRFAITRIARARLVRYVATLEQEQNAPVAEDPYEDKSCKRAGDNAHGFDAVGLSSDRSRDEHLGGGSY